MKPAPFAYARPATIDAVLDELEEDGAKVLAGGQSLVPVLAMRLGRPTTLVDISAVEDLSALRVDASCLRVGATVRQRQVQLDPASRAVPLLGKALPWVGHREIRSRGTVCGSIAHADPSAELPAVALCLEATAHVVGRSGSRVVPAEEFFLGPMTTALGPDELLAEVRFPVARDGEGFGFAEFARRHGDFALAGTAVRVRQDRGGTAARAACFGIADRPVSADVSDLLRNALERTGPTPEEAELRVELAPGTTEVADQLVTTEGDAHASRDYRRRLLSGLLARELCRAYLHSTRRSGGVA